MKKTRKSLGTLSMMGLMVLMVGCRPTIEFDSSSTIASSGDTVTLEWDVEFARGTSSSKVTVTELGEVEPVASGDVVVNETKEYQIRVSAFVLGIPTTAKEYLTITVPEEDFATYDFEGGVNNDWTAGHVFYEQADRSQNPNDREGVLCWDSLLSGSAYSLNVADPGSGLGDSLKFCSDNNASDQAENNRYTMTYIQRTIRNDDVYSIERNTRYKIGFEIAYGIKFSADTCDNITERLSAPFEGRNALLGNMSLVVGAAKDIVTTRTEGGVVKLVMEDFLSDLELDTLKVQFPQVPSSDGYPVDGAIFKAEADKAEGLRISSDVLKDADPEDDIQDVGCDDSAGVIDPRIVTGLYKGMTDTGFVYQTANEDRELQLFIGFLNTTDESDIEFYIDSVRVQLFEE